MFTNIVKRASIRQMKPILFEINNSLAFPGIFRGALDHRIKQFNEQMFVRAAEALAEYVKEPTPDQVLPSMFDKGVIDVVKEAIRD